MDTAGQIVTVGAGKVELSATSSANARSKVRIRTRIKVRFRFKGCCCVGNNSCRSVTSTLLPIKVPSIFKCKEATVWKRLNILPYVKCIASV